MKLELQKPCFRDAPFLNDNTGWWLYISQYFYGNAFNLYKEQGKLGHGALDLRTPLNIPIYAMHDGYVLEATHDNASSIPNNPTGTDGLYIRLITDKKYEYKNTETYFWTTYVHLSKLNVKQKDFVYKGQFIGVSGNTGYSNGPHTHCGLCPVYKKFAQNWYEPIDPDNGFKGYINPLPYLTNMFEIIKIKDKKDQYIVFNNSELEVIPDEETLQRYFGKIFSTRLEELTQEQFDAGNYKIIGKFPSVKLMRVFSEIAPDILLPE